MIRCVAIIKNLVKKNKDIIYGARAMNVQVPAGFRRSTFDFDIYTNQPSARAKQLDKVLDNRIYGGKDVFYVKPAIHEGTHKVMHRGSDMRKGIKDDVGIADFTKKPRKVLVIVKNGIRYETIASIKKVKRAILKDPESKYRHQKDRLDLRRIKFGRKFVGR